MPMTYRPRYVPRVKRHRVYPKKKRVSFAKKVKSVVKRELETHVLSTVATFADLETASQRIINLSAIGLGDTPANRTGDEIEPLRVKGKIAVIKKGANATNPVVVRVMLVKFKQCDGTAPTLADILPDSFADLNFLSVDQPFTDTLGYGLSQARRKFQILYDKTKMFSFNTADSQNIMKMWSINKKLSGKIHYIGSASTDEGNNQVYLFIHTNAGDDILQEQHDIRLFFKDA